MNPQKRSTTSLFSRAPASPAVGLALMLFPNGFAHHFVLVPGDIGSWPLVDQIEHEGDIDFALCLTQVLSEKPAHVFGKGDAQRGRLGMGPPLHFRIDRDLGSRIHDGAIMPSLSDERK